MTAFVYDESWPASKYFRVLSLSIPLTANLTTRGKEVTSYFDNLLPDNPQIRKRLSDRLRVRPDTFDLLTAIGRDCVGAVQLLPSDTEPTGWNVVHATVLNDAEVAAHLRAVPAPVGGVEAGDLFRISIAGAQEKSAFLRSARGRNSLPTANIRRRTAVISY